MLFPPIYCGGIMAIKIDVPFDSEILDFYKNEGIVGLDNDSEFKKEMFNFP